MIQEKINDSFDIYISEFNMTNFPMSLLLRMYADCSNLLNTEESFDKEKDSVAMVCDVSMGNVPHRDLSIFFKEEDEVINVVGIYIASCFNSNMFGDIFKKMTEILGKNIYIPKDCFKTKDIPKEFLEETYDVIDNIPGINKLSEIAWIY